MVRSQTGHGLFCLKFTFMNTSRILVSTSWITIFFYLILEQEQRLVTEARSSKKQTTKTKEAVETCTEHVRREWEQSRKFPRVYPIYFNTAIIFHRTLTHPTT